MTFKSAPLKRQTFFFYLCGITLLAIFLGANRDLFAIPAAVHDDRLFVNRALDLLQGHWLGDYNQYTLIKGPFFPLFMAVNNVLGFPLLVAEQVLFCLAGLTFLYALTYLYRQPRWPLILIYALYAFQPVAFSLNRTVRESLYVSLTVFFFAGGVLGMAHLLGRVPPQRTAAHAALLGLSSAAFWLTREEGLWLVPSLLLLFVIGAVSQYRQSRSLKAVLGRSRMFGLSLLLCSVCVLCVACLNYANYGVFLARSELLSNEFGTAYGSLTRVKAATWDAHIPVPHAARQQLYAQSPSFRQLQAALDDPATVKGWSSFSCPFYPSTCGDYAGGWFVWSFRDAVVRAGYTTAPRAMQFYSDLANEVNRLCDMKQLQCTKPHTGTSPPLRPEHWQALPRALWSGIKVSVKLEQLNPWSQVAPSGSDRVGSDLMASLTRTATTPQRIINCPRQSEFKHLDVMGWFGRPSFGIRPEQPKVGWSEDYLLETRLPSPDLASFFHNPALSMSRFQLDVCCKTCLLAFTDVGGRAVKQVDLLKGASHSDGTDDAYFWLDSVKPILPELPTTNERKLGAYAAVNQVIGFLLPYAECLALGLWCLRLIGCRVMPLTPLYAVVSSLLLAVVARFLLLALIDVTSFPAMNLGYLAPLLPLKLLFTLLACVDGAMALRLRLGKGDRHNASQNEADTAFP